MSGPSINLDLRLSMSLCATRSSQTQNLCEFSSSLRNGFCTLCCFIEHYIICTISTTSKPTSCEPSRSSVIMMELIRHYRCDKANLQVRANSKSLQMIHQTTILQAMQQIGSRYCEKPGHLIKNCRKLAKKEQLQEQSSQLQQLSP